MVGLSGNNLAIGISLILRDQFSVGANKAGNSLHQLQSKAERAATESARNMNAVSAGMGLAVMSGMKEWLRAGLEFDKQMTYMYSITDDKNKLASKKMRDRAKDVGVQTIYSAQEVSEAMVVMAQAGQNTQQIYENIYATAVLGAATMSGVRESASVMNDIMIGFDIEASERNAMRVADIITKTINDSNIALDSYAETMKYTIPTAKTLGVTLEELSAITSVLGNAGLKGSMAGTGTENMIRLMAIGAGKAEGTKQMDAIHSMGLTRNDFVDSQGNLRSVAEILPLIGRGLQGLGNADRIKVMSDLFNLRGARPAQVLTFATGLERFSEALEGINNSDGTSMKTSNDMMQSAWGQTEQLEEAIGNLKIAFTEALTPAIKTIVPMLTGLLTVFSKVAGTPMGKMLVMAGTGFVIVKTAASAYKTVMLSIKLLHGQLATASTNSTNTIVSNYNRQAMAAKAAAASQGITPIGRGNINGGQGGIYRNLLNTLGIGGTALGVNSAGNYYRRSNGRLISRELANRYHSRLYGTNGTLGASNLMGKASPYAMVAGLALGAGAQAAGTETGLGRGLNVGATVLSGASTGAMLGSVIPGVGNVVGALVGGVGGLLWGLYDDAQQEKERVEAAKAEYEANKQNRPSGFDSAKWKENAQAYLKMKEGDEMYIAGTGNEMFKTNLMGANNYLNQGGVFMNGNQMTPRTNITINIDGKQAMQEEIQKDKYRTFINLGGI